MKTNVSKGGPVFLSFTDYELEEELVCRLVNRVKKERDALKPNSKWWAMRKASGDMDKLTTEMRTMVHEKIREIE
jgi:hypothetical protein